MEPTTIDFKRQDNFLFSNLRPGNRALVLYTPNGGQYSGRSFILDHIVPSEKIQQVVEGVGRRLNWPGRAYYTSIYEVLAGEEGTREIEPMTEDFAAIFSEAIEKDKGSVLVAPNGSLVERLEDVEPWLEENNN